MRRENHQSRSIQRITPADRVERVLEVVAAGGHAHARIAKVLDRGESPGHRRLHVAALEKEVRLWQRHDTNAGLREFCRRFPLSSDVLHAETHAMAGRHPAVEPGCDHALGEIRERRALGVGVLICMQVEWNAQFTGEVDQRSIGEQRVVVEVRTTTDDVDAHRHRLTCETPMRLAPQPRHGPAEQCNDL